MVKPLCQPGFFVAREKIFPVCATVSWGFVAANLILPDTSTSFSSWTYAFPARTVLLDIDFLLTVLFFPPSIVTVLYLTTFCLPCFLMRNQLLITVLVQAVTTEHYRPSGLDNRHLFLIVLEDGSSRSEYQYGWVLVGSPLFLLSSHGGEREIEGERERKCSCLF